MFLLMFICLVLYPDIATAISPENYWEVVGETQVVLQRIGYKGHLSKDLVFYILSFLPFDFETWIPRGLINLAKISWSLNWRVFCDIEWNLNLMSSSSTPCIMFELNQECRVNPEINYTTHNKISALWDRLNMSLTKMETINTGADRIGPYDQQFSAYLSSPQFGEKFMATYNIAKTLSGYTYMPGLHDTNFQQLQEITAHLQTLPSHGRDLSSFMDPLLTLLKDVKPLIKPKVILVIFSLLALNPTITQNIDLPV